MLDHGIGVGTFSNERVETAGHLVATLLAQLLHGRASIRRSGGVSAEESVAEESTERGVPSGMKKLFLPLLLLASGIALLVLNGSSTWRFPRAEAASYVMTALGGVWLVIALLRGVTAVKPEVGCTVKFWGPDGRTKLEGRIVEKGAKDAADWLPDRNRCWFVDTIIEVRRKYGLTIDQREADAIDQVLASCPSTDLEPTTCDLLRPSAILELQPPH